MDAFVRICATYLKAPVLSGESETCLGLSEKVGGFEKGRNFKGREMAFPLHVRTTLLALLSANGVSS